MLPHMNEGLIGDSFIDQNNSTNSSENSPIPHAANLFSPGFPSCSASGIQPIAHGHRNLQNSELSSSDPFDLSYLPHAPSVLRDFDFANAQHQSNPLYHH